MGEKLVRKLTLTGFQKNVLGCVVHARRVDRAFLVPFLELEKAGRFIMFANGTDTQIGGIYFSNDLSAAILLEFKLCPCLFQVCFAHFPSLLSHFSPPKHQKPFLRDP